MKGRYTKITLYVDTIPFIYAHFIFILAVLRRYSSTTKRNITFESQEIRAEYYLVFEKVNFLSYYTKKCLVPCKRNKFELKHIGMLESGNNSGFAVWLDRFVSRTTSEPQRVRQQA